ncbi:MAG: GNAT family N-acetyltransferase, partial [Acidimicrobiales bacterium]
MPTVVELVEAAYRGRGGWTHEAELIDGPRTSPDEVTAALGTLVVAVRAGEVAACFQLRSDGEVAW